MKSEDDLVFDEASNSIICFDVDIQHEHIQQKHVSKSYFFNKEHGR